MIKFILFVFLMTNPTKIESVYQRKGFETIEACETYGKKTINEIGESFQSYLSKLEGYCVIEQEETKTAEVPTS